MKKYIITGLAILAALTETNAQQDPHYTQYMYNMNVMNPAYAGSKESISMGVLYRHQWDGIEGAPRTFTANIHSPIGRNVGLGLSAVSDQIGPVKEQNVYGDFSYTLNLGGEHKLALGLKAGATFHSIGLFSDINSSLPDRTDDAFSENSNETFFNVGAGLFYYTDKYYVAASVPNFIKSQHLLVRDNGQKRYYGEEASHYFIAAGYVFDLNDKIKFKPSAMVKTAFDAPTSYDASANFLFNEKFEIGGTYRLDDSFGAMVNFAITPSLRIGYAYDHVVSDLKINTPASHEFMLLYDFNLSKKVSRSPRFF